MGEFKSQINYILRLPYSSDILLKYARLLKSSDFILKCSLAGNRLCFYRDLLKISDTKTDLTFYYSSNQSLQINDFRTSFKNPTSSRHAEKVRLINDGEDSISVHSISTADDQFYVKGFEHGIELFAGEELNLELYFRPSQYGFYTSRLIIKTSMSDHKVISIDLFGVRKQGKSYYRFIDGVRYDRLLLEIAYSVMSQNPDKVIDYDQIRIITKNVWDAGRITTTEKRSLKYIWENYDWSDNAREWFKVGYGKKVELK